MPDNSDLPLTGRRRLYLLRHGHVNYFAPDIEDFTQVPLTDEGREQAQAAGRALAGIRFDAAFDSGLPRTRETLSIVLGEGGSEPPRTSIDGFAELRGGQVVVETPEELAARLAFSFDGADEEGASFLPGGELFADAEARIVASLDDLLAQHRWRQAVLVAHEGVNRILLAHLTGGGLAALTHFEQDLCGINVLDFDVVPEGDSVRAVRVILKAVNLTVHDQVKEGLPRTSLEHLFGIDFGGARPVA
ncbi:histidine phosphatase family protein [Parvularcula sp. ZS-1/3]|uniref:Histidine phosphatase family protein n=1 Tax=Parvularcula mediterranea TaxID=2732508 RepID=A0A7Y3W460_9PROT|nr:histidine phosphatase family protein [Parvularcula mediterranea]NNU14917.1 histidine phosphatase family protein [Parvularcula mediterranea]